MKLVTFEAGGAPQVGVLKDGAVFPLAALVDGAPEDMVGVIEAGNGLLKKAAAAADDPSHKGKALPLESLTLCAPIAKPGKILCLGLNYADHAA
ncbi:MAG: Rv2993c-like domain-containing protein, partial [Pseudomonadota bacterium]